MKEKRPKLDDLVQSVTLYTTKATVFHGYVLPFIFVYPIWIYIWLGLYGFYEFYEGGFVGLAGIAFVQILSCLCCYWSVHINCLLTCKYVSIFFFFELLILNQHIL